MSNILQETYARFEDRFRGSREDILHRLRVYEPLLALVRGDRGTPTAIDYGCGRGEWLQILQQAGWDGRGVDTNVAMLTIASQHGLRAERADALAHLGRAPSESTDLISAFHLVEHLQTETLLLFIRESLRVLRPNGVLLLETPNPENLLVGTCNFYLDPTHQRPIPPALLKFFVEDGGAAYASIVRLNGEPGHAGPEGTLVAAIRPMFTVALDYAVIGSRSSDAAFVAGVDRFVTDKSQPNPIDLSKVAAIDVASTTRQGAAAAAIVETHAALAQHGCALQASTDRTGAELAEMRARIFDELALETATRAQTLAEGLERIETTMTENFSRETAAREHALAKLDALQAKLVPLSLLPKITQQFDQLSRSIAHMSDQLGARERELEAQLGSANAALHEQAQREAALKQYIEALLASRSWRVTRPLRALTSLRGKLMKDSVPTEMPRPNAETVSVKKKRSIDPQTLVMIDADPNAIAEWRALLSSTRAGDQVNASVD